MPPGPTLGDNAQQGSSVEVALAWNISEKDPVAPKPPIPSAPTPAPPVLPQGGKPPRLVVLRVPAQKVVEPRRLKVWVACELRCKLKFGAAIDNAPKKARMGRKAKRARILMSKHVFKALKVKGKTKKWVTLRVPYPLNAYQRGLDGRIDDPKAGWKGRGLWFNDGLDPVIHNEVQHGWLGHAQLRPNPLAR